MRPAPYPTDPTPDPEWHLRGRVWIASCPGRGYQLTSVRPAAL